MCGFRGFLSPLFGAVLMLATGAAGGSARPALAAEAIPQAPPASSEGGTPAGADSPGTAIPECVDLHALDPIVARKYVGQGNARLAQKDWDEAIADYNEAIPATQKRVRIRRRGFAYYSKGCFDKAIDDYSQAIRLNPKAAAPYAGRGLAQAGKGDFKKAIADYDKAVQLEPEHAATYAARGSVYLREREWDKAIADCREAVRLDPTLACAYGVRGRAYVEKRNWDGAIADYTAAIRLDPKSASAYAEPRLGVRVEGRAREGHHRPHRGDSPGPRSVRRTSTSPSSTDGSSSGTKPSPTTARRFAWTRGPLGRTPTAPPSTSGSSSGTRPSPAIARPSAWTRKCRSVPALRRLLHVKLE